MYIYFTEGKIRVCILPKTWTTRVCEWSDNNFSFSLKAFYNLFTPDPLQVWHFLLIGERNCAPSNCRASDNADLLRVLLKRVIVAIFSSLHLSISVLLLVKRENVTHTFLWYRTVDYISSSDMMVLSIVGDVLCIRAIFFSSFHCVFKTFGHREENSNWPTGLNRERIRDF